MALEDDQENATVGELERVSEFHFDEERRAVRYWVVNTESLLSGSQRRIPPAAFDKVEKPSMRIQITLPRGANVKKHPRVYVDKTIPLDDAQQEYFGYHGWPYY